MVRLTLDHVEAHDRDDARHRQAPSWQPSNTPAQQEVPTLNASWVGGGRDAVGALDGRTVRWTGALGPGIVRRRRNAKLSITCKAPRLTLGC